MQREDILTKIIIGKALEVHKALGPGLLESAYRKCLYYELVNENLQVESEKALPIIYKEITIDHGYRIDLLVENKIVLELKAVEEFTDIHIAQILTYMRLGKYKLGLLMNFNEKMLRNGIKRLIL